MSLLSSAELLERMRRSKWMIREQSIERVFSCGDFAGSIRVVNAVAAEAESADHHPVLAIAWSESDHQPGAPMTSAGVTERDLALGFDHRPPGCRAKACGDSSRQAKNLHTP